MQATSQRKEVIDMATRKIGRDAGSGQFIPVKVAQRRPRTSVVETLPVVKKLMPNKLK